MNVAIIPARSGSKRIPKKNIKQFCGKPIIAYAIEVAIKSKLFDKVVVSTDSKKIVNIAEKYGAIAPFIRPQRLADDHTGIDDVLIHALDCLYKDNKKYSYACCIYPTTPLLTTALLSNGLSKLKDYSASSCFPVVKFCSSIYRALEVNANGRLVMIQAENKMTRTQDLSSAYYDAGQFFWVDVKKYYKTKKILSSDTIPLLLNRYEVVDIDTLEDWEFAELLFEMRRGNQKKLK